MRCFACGHKVEGVHRLLTLSCLDCIAIEFEQCAVFVAFGLSIHMLRLCNRKNHTHRLDSCQRHCGAFGCVVLVS